MPTIRARYKAQRDAMRAALEQHLPPGCRWTAPQGGMFFWVELPAQFDDFIQGRVTGRTVVRIP